MSLAISTALVVLVGILSTNVLGFTEIAGVQPDLVLIIVVFNGYKSGPMQGQVSGFCGGIVEDLLSTAPLGFHALIRMVMGAVSGLPRNRLYLDAILLPVLFVFVATLMKGVLAAAIGVVFGVGEVFPRLFTGPFFLEAAYNSVLAPIFFALINAFRPMHAPTSEAST